GGEGRAGGVRARTAPGGGGGGAAHRFAVRGRRGDGGVRRGAGGEAVIGRAQLRLAIGLALGAASAAAAAAPPPPPLQIAADNVTGSHGPAGDEVLLNGNVRITRGRTVITSDAGHYLRAQGLLLLDGRVRLVDSTTTVT